MSLIQPGTCRHCGCHGESCKRPDGDLCSWAHAGCTVCNTSRCMAAEARRLAVARAKPQPKSKYVGWGYGAIVDDLRRRRRRKKKAA